MYFNTADEEEIPLETDELYQFPRCVRDKERVRNHCNSILKKSSLEIQVEYNSYFSSFMQQAVLMTSSSNSCFQDSVQSLGQDGSGNSLQWYTIYACRARL